MPRNDPTLLFTNAGMVQFKNVFTGLEKRPYARAATAQKCVRAGGKHNDLENVGYTARHHTFFEMLGNFSFGDYFKERAIELAWNLITREFGLARDRLLVTVYAEDDDAAALWAKIAGLPRERIIPIATSDNFWAMGDVGPCGPCSEIFYDHGPAIPGGPPGSADADGDRFVEIWNLVFMQYEQLGPGERVPLPRPSIDTGMGLERIAAVLQGKHDNYDIDLFRALILASADASGVAPDGAHAVSHRVIADHLRASAFLIADGVLPSKEGRGYVLRRIMRRAMRHAHMLGCKEPLMWRLVPALVQQMGAAYPELLRAQPLITETLRLEETNFKQTLERGLRLLEEETARLGPDERFSGETAFRLYDTYGFPLDLTEDVLRGQGRTVAVEGFDAAMARQREEAREQLGRFGRGGDRGGLVRRCATRSAPPSFSATRPKPPRASCWRSCATASGSARPTPATRSRSSSTRPRSMPNWAARSATPGSFSQPPGAELAVRDTVKKAGELHVHLGRLARGALKDGDAVELRVDGDRRRRLRANHSVTHLLHQALRRRLGEHVTQKGSLVAPDRLRFDFSHPRPLTADDIRAIEAEVNERIRTNAAVGTRLLTPDRAVAEGALALFGEKYGDEVRVVSMGGTCDGDEPAVLGRAVRRHACPPHRRYRPVQDRRRNRDRLGRAPDRSADRRRGRSLSGRGGGDPAPGRRGVAHEPGRIAGADRQPRRRAPPARTRAGRGAAGVGQRRPGRQDRPTKRIGEIAFDGRVVDDVPGRELKSLADDLKRRIGSGIVAVVSRADGKAAIVVGVTADLAGRFDAVELVRLGAEALGGKGGGGRADMAQAGGPDAARAEAALAAIERAVAAKVQAERPRRQLTSSRDSLVQQRRPAPATDLLTPMRWL